MTRPKGSKNQPWTGWHELECENQYEEQEAIRNLSNKLRQQGFVWVRGERKYVDDPIEAPYVYILIRMWQRIAKLEEENKNLRQLLAEHKKIHRQELIEEIVRQIQELES